MTDMVAELEEQVMRLAPPDRARLLDRLIASVDRDESVQEAWLDEATRRLEAHDRGEAVALDGDEVMLRLKANLAGRAV